ncbi:MAG: PEP/pyruvate-binding domain-containing protein [Syntrophobacteraceae bacterium]
MPVRQRARRVFAAMWRALLTFLEVIGPRRGEAVDPAEQIARLRLFHTEFRKAIAANNSFLENLGEMERKLHDGGFIDRSFVKHKAIRVISDVHAMVESINVIASDRYAALREAFERIATSLLGVMEKSTESGSAEILLDLSVVAEEHSGLVGGKMARLSETVNKLGMPAPDGFIVTVEGYRLLVEEGGIRSWIQDKHLELESVRDVERVSHAIRDRIHQLTLSPSLEAAILAARDRLADRLGRSPPLAVRSSAVGEDGEFSFAGQFLTLLNVGREEICAAYLRVAASLYSPEAMHYRLLHGIPGESAEMAVGFIAMVDAAASGVLYTREPDHPDSGKLLIQAVTGLGVSLVDGRTSPEAIRVSRDLSAPGVERTPGAQSTRIVCAPRSGVREIELSAPEKASFRLADEEAVQLARWALELEDHFGGPQDVEWAMDERRRLFILQSRPLRLAALTGSRGRPVPGYPLLVEGGETACPGVASGPAVHLSESDDIDSFPDGGILVVRRSSPGFVRLMSQTAAIVTDVGSATGHMASLVREFGIPALLDTRSATRSIPPGAVVTVDADGGFVYEGIVPELLERKARSRSGPEAARDPQRTAGHRFIKEALAWISPLNLTDPNAPSFRPEECRTLHDLARFIHEKSYHEMFGLGDSVGDLRTSSLQLDVFLPIDLYVIDLGGGISGATAKRRFKRSQVTSAPLAALLKGMLNEKLQRFGPKPMDVGGFLSIVMRHAANDPTQEASFCDPCYAIVSDKYLNYTARVGYHFSVVDCYCGQTRNKNYITMLFHGGAADFVRRVRRTRAIADIMESKGFSVKIEGDMVHARLAKSDKETTERHLESIGALLQFFRQMDAAMTSDEAAAGLRDAFLRGDYGLQDLPRR